MHIGSNSPNLEHQWKENAKAQKFEANKQILKQVIETFDRKTAGEFCYNVGISCNGGYSAISAVKASLIEKDPSLTFEKYVAPTYMEQFEKLWAAAEVDQQSAIVAKMKQFGVPQEKIEQFLKEHSNQNEPIIKEAISQWQTNSNHFKEKTPGVNTLAEGKKIIDGLLNNKDLSLKDLHNTLKQCGVSFTGGWFTYKGKPNNTGQLAEKRFGVPLAELESKGLAAIAPKAAVPLKEKAKEKPPTIEEKIEQKVASFLQPYFAGQIAEEDALNRVPLMKLLEMELKNTGISQQQIQEIALKEYMIRAITSYTGMKGKVTPAAFDQALKEGIKLDFGLALTDEKLKELKDEARSAMWEREDKEIPQTVSLKHEGPEPKWKSKNEMLAMLKQDKLKGK